MSVVIGFSSEYCYYPAFAVQVDLPPAFVHVRIRQVSAVASFPV